MYRSRVPHPDQPRVLISYAHEDAVTDRVTELADSLRRCGIDAWIDRYAAELNWTVWMAKQVDDAHFVLCVCTELYLSRWKEKRPGGGVEFEAGLLQTLIRSGEEKCVPLFFGPLPSEARKLLPITISAEPIALESPSFDPEKEIPCDALRLLRLLRRLPECEPVPLGSPLSEEVLRSAGVRPPDPEELAALPQEERDVLRDSTLGQLRHAIQIDRDKQWAELTGRIKTPRLAAVLYGTKDNALRLFSRRMASDLGRAQHRIVPFPSVGFDRPATRPSDWRQATLAVLVNPRTNLEASLAYESREAWVSLFFGPVPSAVQKHQAAKEGFRRFLMEDLSPALRALDAERRVWVVLCLETDKLNSRPPWGDLLQPFAEDAGIPTCELPEVKLPAWEHDIEAFLMQNGVPQAEWEGVYKTYRDVVSGEEQLEALFEKLDSLVEGFYSSRR